jgi:hypothetical protein
MSNQNKDLVLIQTNAGGYAYVKPELVNELVLNGAKVANPEPETKKKDLTLQETAKSPKKT